ncbi:MAG: TIGR02300 family protein [Alphaproteobacteria bacterium]|nr:TIGR02300 family protein [Alphaproteobacteria bacterium]MDE1929953.1 TIGR02300 family protein [Alphaproteobacteria bacterium]
MTKVEWGTKRICPNCGTRYYDMRRDPIMCPKCGAPFDAEVLVKTRKSRAVASAAVEETAPLEEELEADLAAEPDEAGEVVTEIPTGEEAEEETAAEEPAAAKATKGKGRGKGADEEKKDGDDEEEDQEVLEDASELGEDEDDMAEVIENVDEEDDR